MFSFISGTCINNTSVMMFKKGGFEVTKVVYPVAVKVRPFLYFILYLILYCCSYNWNIGDINLHLAVRQAVCT